MINPLRVRIEAALKRIQDPDLQSFVYKVIDALPEKAWHREASLKYHHPDEQGDGGNVLHEIRVAHVAEIIAEVCDLPLTKRDLLRAASLLHDCCRHGLEATDPYSAKNHAHLVRSFIEQQHIESKWTEPVCSIIETHMARWGPIPYTPEMNPHDILVLADYIATQTTIQVNA